MNPRYKHFRQTFFTAGDSEQFESRIGSEPVEVFHTFRYMFHKFKKGIFVHIFDNKFVHFLPFCKAYYVNECADRMAVDPAEFANFDEMFEYIYEHTSNKMRTRPATNVDRAWWFNNGIFRYDVPRVELDKGVEVVYDLLVRIMPQLDPTRHYMFFINKRDFPVLTLNNREPFDCVYGDLDHPLVSHSYPRYCPIFSMTTSANHADIPMPNWDDTATVALARTVPWDDKMARAVFRGSSTGLGTTPRNNPRIRLCELSNKYPDMIDAGITKWNLRPRKLPADEYYRTISHTLVKKFGHKRFLTYEQQSAYKYIINVPGYVSSFRLRTLLQLGSVVLHVQSAYHNWYEQMLKPYVHYVPVKSNLSDLVSQINWCMQNDVLCYTIARNGRVFYEKYLTNAGQDAYMLQHLSMLPAFPAGVDDIKEISRPDYLPTTPEMFPLTPLTRRVFASHDGRYVLKHMTQADRDKADREVRMYQQYLCKLGSVYGWRCVHGLVEDGDSPENVYTLMDRVDGITFLDFLMKPECYSKNPAEAFETVLMVLLQVCIVLSNAYGTFGFVHRDCVPWNIMMESTGPARTGLELADCDQVYRIQDVNWTVRIIDYDKSRVPADDNYAYVVNNDIVGLVLHVMYLVLTNTYWPKPAVETCTEWYHAIFNAPDPDSRMVEVIDLFKKFDNITNYSFGEGTNAKLFAAVLHASRRLFPVDRWENVIKDFSLRRMLV